MMHAIEAGGGGGLSPTGKSEGLGRDSRRNQLDKDTLEEYKYRQWQDLSPDAMKSFDFLSESGAAKYIKLNIYKLYDFSTLAQHDLQC